jgi:hypothetical protein
MTPHEVNLFLGADNGKRFPVRCCGYVENGAFHIEEVWLDFTLDNALRRGSSLNIIENLKPEVVRDLEDEGTEQRGWEGV